MNHLSAAAVDAWSIYPSRVPLSEETDVFRALGDPSRRLLLDSLFASDGQTLGELSAQLPGMTRFGVMKHLRILEAAGLVVSRKIGRERLHYLNAVPIRMIHDRWIGKYAEVSAGALTHLKPGLAAAAPEQARHVFQVYIRTTAEELWEAITDPDLTFAGEVVDADPPERLVMRWSFRRNHPDSDDPPSRVTWEIEPRGNTCRLTVVHDNFPYATETFKSLAAWWPLVLSSLKSLLETGEGLTFEHY
jgi:uncharacterized protein YndB with AHSA1/START domain/DNA-binding transcriptional ArsR family regulator